MWTHHWSSVGSSPAEVTSKNSDCWASYSFAASSDAMAARSRHRDPASEHRPSSAPHCRIAGVELQYRFQIGVRSLVLELLNLNLSLWSSVLILKGQNRLSPMCSHWSTDISCKRVRTRAKGETNKIFTEEQCIRFCDYDGLRRRRLFSDDSYETIRVHFFMVKFWGLRLRSAHSILTRLECNMPTQSSKISLTNDAATSLQRLKKSTTLTVRQAALMPR